MSTEMKETLLDEHGQPNLDVKPMPIEDMQSSVNGDSHHVNQHKFLNQKVIYTILVMAYSISLLFFTLGCLVNRMVMAVRGSGTTSVYLGLTFTGDAFGLILSSFGITTIFCWALRRVKIIALIIFMLMLIMYSVYMFVIGILGNLFWGLVDPLYPYIITTMIPCMLIQFGGLWFAFNLCWDAVLRGHSSDAKKSGSMEIGGH
jgi:hypothetical protein